MRESLKIETAGIALMDFERFPKKRVLQTFRKRQNEII